MRVAVPPNAFDVAPGVLVLRDGSVAAVRAAGPADREAVRAFFHELSPESRRLRFFSAGNPSDASLDVYSATPDPATAVTLIATRSVNGESKVLGLSSYMRVNQTTAEVAFAVDDAFGGKGIATGMLERLAALAGRAGFERFQATTLFENLAMLDVFRDSGFMIRSKSDGGAIEVELALSASSEGLTARDERERIATAASVRPFFEPTGVAIVGVSRSPSGIGRRIFDAMVSAGYAGPLYAVNDRGLAIPGRHVVQSIRDLPPEVDLAIIAVPRDAVLPAIDACAEVHVRAVVVITAGFAEAGDAGKELQRQLVTRLRGYGMRMIGPNCMGLLNTATSLNASFSPLFPPTGRVAFSSQSGALGLTILSLATDRELGLSSFVSVGNKADVSGNDLLQFWEGDPATAVVLLYLESFGNPRRFARLARRIGRSKPIVALKAGRTRAGSRAAGSHTAALAASEVAVDALFHQTGVIRADTIDEMFDIAACLETQPLPRGRRVAVVTNAGGPGILAVDACVAAGLKVVEFTDETQAALRAFLPTTASLSNPVDMIASAGPDEYRRTVEVVLGAAEIDAVIVIYTPIDLTTAGAIATAISEGILAGRARGGTDRTVLACVMSDLGRPKPLTAGGERVPAYSFPENAARTLGKVERYAAWRHQTPGLFWNFNDIRADEARALCRQVVETRGDSWLTDEEMRRVASAFGLPTVPAVVARSAEEAAALASVIGFPVVAKLIGKTLLHKSDIGAVRVHLQSPSAVRRAFSELNAVARLHGIADTVDGVVIQQMVTGGTELMIGVADDPLFGPLVGVGLGGVEVEALGDVHFRIAPLTDRDADEVVREMRGFKLLLEHRGRPRADVEAFTELVLRLSRLAEEIPEISELDLNPVIVLPAGNGCRIVDARARVRRPAPFLALPTPPSPTAPAAR